MSENPLYECPAMLSVIGFLLTGNYYYGIIVAAGLLGFSVKFPDKRMYVKHCNRMLLIKCKLNNKIF